MAFTDEGNFLLKDMIIRSDFRLVDAEIRVGDVTARQRVSSLLQRQLVSRETIAVSAGVPVLPPGSIPLGSFPGPPPVGGLPPVVPDQPAQIGPARLVSQQVYTVRGSNVPNNVTRGTNIVSDGILTRVTGGVSGDFDFTAFDDGISLLISDSDQVTTVGRVSGDFDLLELGRGGIPSTFHGIGVNVRVTAAGFAAVDNFDIRFHRSVRAGQRFGVDINVGGTAEYWVAFEVTEFVGGPSATEILRETIIETVRVPPPPAGFTPVMMAHPILPNVVVEDLASFRFRFALGYTAVGNVQASGVSLL